MNTNNTQTTLKKHVMYFTDSLSNCEYYTDEQLKLIAKMLETWLNNHRSRYFVWSVGVADTEFTLIPRYFHYEETLYVDKCISDAWEWFYGLIAEE